MQADSFTPHLLMGKPVLFEIPPYQRKYSWTIHEWRTVLIDLDRLLSESDSEFGSEGGRTHFFGSIVTKNAGRGAGRTPKHEVIDGQQRLTTITLLLAALRELSNETSQKMIAETISNDREGAERYTLSLSEADQPALQAIIDQDTLIEDSPLTRCYQFFLREMNVHPEPDRLVEAILHGLTIIEIDLKASDDTHRIFQTLNSTGRALQASDLIRNHFFMLTEDPDYAAYKKYWKPMEDNLKGSLNLFFWVYLVAFVDHAVPRKRVYETFANEVLGPIESNPKDVVAKMKELHGLSNLYLQITNPSSAKKSKVIKKSLERSREWDTSHHHPLLLLLLHRVENSKMSESEFGDACLLIESYLVRRMLTDLRTNNLNRYFTSIVGKVEKSEQSSLSALQSEIRRETYGFPTDDEVFEVGQKLAFYKAQRSNQRHFILKRIEEKLSGKEVVSWDANFQIEHILPQSFPDEWRGFFDSVEQMQSVVDSIGNLTLTAYNPELSNSPLADKQEIYRESKLSLNKPLCEPKRWGQSEIDDRAVSLLTTACQIWQSPGDRVDVTNDEILDQVNSLLRSRLESEWTTSEDLAAAIGVDSERIEAAIRSSQSMDAIAVLTDRGKLAKLSSLERLNEESFVTQLFERGIFEDLENPVARSESRVRSFGDDE